MIAREELHRLVDELPEGELLPAERFLEYLRDRGGQKELEIHLAVDPNRTYRVPGPRFARREDAELFRLKVSFEGEPEREERSA